MKVLESLDYYDFYQATKRLNFFDFFQVSVYLYNKKYTYAYCMCFFFPLYDKMERIKREKRDIEKTMRELKTMGHERVATFLLNSSSKL
jgi:hypothetical protein